MTQPHTMQRSRHALTSIVQVVACAVLALATGVQGQAQDKKTDPTGTWTWTSPGRNGGPERKSTLKLKTEGDKVTGTISSPGRQGAVTDTPIADGKLKGNEISFTTTR